MAQRSGLRASDADREQAAERLRQATAEGRLRPDELEQRLGAALRATTYGELDALLADLPGPSLARPRRSTVAPWVPPVVALAIAIPVAMLVLAVVIVLLTGLFAGWVLWLVVGWWFFGARHRAFARARYGPRYGPRGRYGPPRRPQPRPNSWL